MKSGEVKFNERWAEMLGYRLAELEPLTFKTWEKLCHPEDFVQSEEPRIQVRSATLRHLSSHAHFLEYYGW
ncbi:PAS domain-containing protein, partial [Vibrio mediterranei]|uniref:PAS domain-containing protein n=1 Tax=Vibrio mediterranei TaxID=689 RepID=UPI00406930D9